MTDGAQPTGPSAASQGGASLAKVFESYGRKDADALALRLKADLAAEGYQVWLDADAISAGRDFMSEIDRAIGSSDVMIALLSPHAIRCAGSGDEDSVCLDEIARARFGQPRTPIVPVMAVDCQPPLTIFRLDYVDLTDWQDPTSYELGLERLKQGISAALVGGAVDGTLERPLVAKLDPFDFGAFLNSKRRHFYGREWLFSEIEAWRAREGERALLITGDPGAGKSAIVAELVHRNTEGQVLAYHCCQGNVPATRMPGKFVRSIAAMLASQLPAFSAAIERGRPLELLRQADVDPETAFEQGLLAPLAAIEPPEGLPRYILVDALDEALVTTARSGGTTILDLLHRRAEEFPEWLRLVATTRRDRQVLERFRAVRSSALNAQDPRNRADLEGYVEARLAEPGVRAAFGSDVDPAAVARELGRLSQGNFLYAHQVLTSVLHGDLAVGHLSEIPPGLTELYDDYFERTFPDDASYAPVRDVLTVLLGARSGLTRAQLAGILSVSSVGLERALAPLSGYLAEEDGALRLFHKSLADWLTDPTRARLRFVVEPAAGHERLLGYCRRWRQLDDDYPLRELPAHLAAAAATDEMTALLATPEFDARRRAAGIADDVRLQDYRTLCQLFIRAERVDDLVQLALTADGLRRDGVALGLSQAGTSADATVHEVVARLASRPRSRRGADEPLPPDELNGRIVAIGVAAERGYRDVLETLALDPSPAVRAILVPHLFSYWKRSPEDCWALLDQLAPHFTRRLGTPRQELVETIGGLVIAIASASFEDEATMLRLGEYLAGLVGQVLSSPVRRAVGKGLLLKAGIAALTKVIRDQPEYQPANLAELQRCYPRPTLANDKARQVLAVLDDPERGAEEIARVMCADEVGFDLLLMSLTERALVVAGSRDATEAVRAIACITREGPSWFAQSGLYSLSKILESREPGNADEEWLQTYAELMDDFVFSSRATLTTGAATYAGSAALAGIEIVFERHRPTGQARFLRRYFEFAMAEGDLDLAGRVLKAAHLVSLLGQPLIALDALEGVVSAAEAHPPLRASLVEVLANVRLFADTAVDRFLQGHEEAELSRLVVSASPTLSANEFPTMIDLFANHQLVTSEAGRREICGAYRRAIEASSSSEVLYDLVVWVLGLLPGTPRGG